VQLFQYCSFHRTRLRYHALSQHITNNSKDFNSNKRILLWRYLYKSFTHIIHLAHSDKREHIINARKAQKVFVPHKKSSKNASDSNHAEIEESRFRKKKKDEGAAQPSKPCWSSSSSSWAPRRPRHRPRSCEPPSSPSWPPSQPSWQPSQPSSRPCRPCRPSWARRPPRRC